MGKSHSKDTFNQWDLDRFSNVTGKRATPDHRLHLRRTSIAFRNPTSNGGQALRGLCRVNWQKQSHGQEGIPSVIQRIVFQQ